MGYHKKKIKRGVVGEFSKIEEEFYEAQDAHETDNKVMLFQELSDMLGAIEEYISKYNLTLEDLIVMKNLTKKVFKEGYRK